MFSAFSYDFYNTLSMGNSALILPKNLRGITILLKAKVIQLNSVKPAVDLGLKRIVDFSK